MNTAINVILSILLGMIPDTLFLTLFLIYTKNLKEKRIKLFLLITFSYILCIMIIRHQILFYIIFIILLYINLKILYKEKTQIIDVFVISISTIYLTIVSFVCSKFINENYIRYYILLFINKVLLFIIFIFRKYFNNLYKIYCKLWNRNNKEKRPIKSITLRNISLIVLNIFIFLCNIFCLYISSLK